MSEAKLDQIVKGAPQPDVTVIAGSSPSSSPERAQQEVEEPKKPGSHGPASDPLGILPSSPPQIYLNLLILEASLRAQYLTLRARRRLHNFFLGILFVWVLSFTYLLFYRPREDGQGHGGSPYWVVDMSEKIGWMVGLMTFFLMWATGQLDRGVRWPRRWVGITNRGLRGMNLKIVILRGPWWQRILSYPMLLFPYSSFSSSQGSAFHYLELPEKRGPSTSRYAYREGYQYPGIRVEDTAPGGDILKLLLLPKPFSPEFRENWEIYRAEYWEKENERRAEIRKIIRKKHREAARQKGGWRWWTGAWRTAKPSRVKDVEKVQMAGHARHPSSRKRRESIAQAAGSHSRSSSRGSVGELDDGRIKPLSRRARTGTSSSRGGSRSSRTFIGDDGVPQLSKRASMVSNAGSSGTESGGDGPNVRTRQRDLELTSSNN